MGISSKDLAGQGFGLERETLRVTRDYKISQTPHPFSQSEKNFERDFGEAQLEIITDVCRSIDAAYEELLIRSKIASARIAGNKEILWLYSNPPYIESDDDIIVADYKDDQIAKKEYRIGLAGKYGKRVMMYSGIHYNLSFPEAITGTTREARDAYYMKLLKYSLACSWFIVLLTAASPIEFNNGYKVRRLNNPRYASVRSGDSGYWNKFTPLFDYSSVVSYCEDVRSYVDSGKLLSEAELYLPVRIKPAGKYQMETLIEKGIDHIELRMFDINPMDEAGVRREDLKFVNLLLLYLGDREDFEFTHELQLKAIADHKQAALYNPGADMMNRARRLLRDMEEYFASTDLNEEASRLIGIQQSKLINGGEGRYAAKELEFYMNQRYGQTG